MDRAPRAENWLADLSRRNRFQPFQFGNRENNDLFNSATDDVDEINATLRKANVRARRTQKEYDEDCVTSENEKQQGKI